MNSRGLRFKWIDYEVEVINAEQRNVEDLAFCSHTSKRTPLQHDKVILCTCNNFLDKKTVGERLINKRIITIEQLCYAYVGNEQGRRFRLACNGEDIVVAFIKAYGVYSALAELVETMR